MLGHVQEEQYDDLTKLALVSSASNNQPTTAAVAVQPPMFVQLPTDPHMDKFLRFASDRVRAGLHVFVRAFALLPRLSVFSSFSRRHCASRHQSTSAHFVMMRHDTVPPPPSPFVFRAGCWLEVEWCHGGVWRVLGHAYRCAVRQ